MLNKNVLELQKYVIEMEKRISVKNFTLNTSKLRAFSYAGDSMIIDDDGDDDNDEEE